MANDGANKSWFIFIFKSKRGCDCSGMTPERLKQFRQKSGLTQQELADLLAYSRGYYSQIECGARPMPKGFYQRACAKMHRKTKELAAALAIEAGL